MQRPRLGQAILAGAAGGAAGTTALNALTYLDMAVRGRPASSTPEQTVKTVADKAGVPVPGERDEKANRLSGLGALMGLAAGVGAGVGIAATYTLLGQPKLPTAVLSTTAAALIVGNGPMTALGITDPRQWSRADWLSDVLPHVAYGVVAAAVTRALTVGRQASADHH